MRRACRIKGGVKKKNNKNHSLTVSQGQLFFDKGSSNKCDPTFKANSVCAAVTVVSSRITPTTAVNVHGTDCPITHPPSSYPAQKEDSPRMIHTQKEPAQSAFLSHPNHHSLILPIRQFKSLQNPNGTDLSTPKVLHTNPDKTLLFFFF